MTSSSSLDPPAILPPWEIVSIQYLRGLAALLVVFHHACDQFPALMDRIPTNAGLGGVDIFFAISGFVIMHTTTRTA
jgi:exopolysaccharide production protein ExoZ